MSIRNTYQLHRAKQISTIICLKFDTLKDYIIFKLDTFIYPLAYLHQTTYKI